MSTYDNAKVRRVQTFEEAAYEYFHPPEDDWYQKNMRKLRKFKIMFPNPSKRGNVVNSKYGSVRKEWYGWSRYMKEKD